MRFTEDISWCMATSHQSCDPECKEVQVPWASLGKSPVIVELDRLYLLAGPKDDAVVAEDDDDPVSPQPNLLLLMRVKIVMIAMRRLFVCSSSIIGQLESVCVLVHLVVVRGIPHILPQVPYRCKNQALESLHACSDNKFPVWPH